MLKAASQGNIAKVRAFLDRGLDVNYHSPSKQATGRTALSEAAIAGHLNIVQLLLEHGADRNWQDHAVGLTPLGWAAYAGHESCVKSLLDAGADLELASHEVQFTPLMQAAMNGHLSIVQLLLDSGANVNAHTSDGRTPLSLAKAKKQVEVATLLMSVGGAEASPIIQPEPILWPAVDVTDEFRDFSFPENVLRGFILAMHRWETESHQIARARRQNPTSVPAPLTLELQQIFQTYCTDVNRPYGRQGSYQHPPEYQPGEELIAANHINSRRAELTTRTNQPSMEIEYLYVMQKKKDAWLIDSKK